jgi:hypothetical protein
MTSRRCITRNSKLYKATELHPWKQSCYVACYFVSALNVISFMHGRVADGAFFEKGVLMGHFDLCKKM